MLFLCPHCNARCQFTSIGDPRHCALDDSLQQAWFCQNCNGTIASHYLRSQDASQAKIHPSNKISPQIDTQKLSESIREGYLEALRNFGDDAYILAVIMCRRVIQQTCIEKGAKQDTLYDQIEGLPIDGALKALAHKLRYWGNTGAHPDILLDEKIGKQDAKTTIDFTEKFLQYIYIIPKEIADIEAGAAPVST